MGRLRRKGLNPPKIPLGTVLRQRADQELGLNPAKLIKGIQAMSRHGHLPPNLVKEREVSARLNVEVATLRRWRWAGTGPRFIKIGGAVRYDPEDLTAFIESSRRSSTSDAGEEAAR